MKMVVITTITSTLDIETMQPEHTVDIEDKDGLSEVSTDVLGVLVIGALRSTETGVRKQFPGADRSAARADAREAPDN